MNTPQTLTQDECAALLWELEKHKDSDVSKRRAVRNHSMAMLMLHAGLRVGEVVKLRQYHLYYKDAPVHSLTIPPEISKSKRERTIPLTDALQETIKAMDFYCWRYVPRANLPFAFYNRNGQRPLTTRQIERIIRRAAEKSIGRPIHPHVLRHTFASALMRKTSMRTVQELLGHTSIQSTQIYTHPNEDDKKQAIATFNAGLSAFE